MRNSTIIVLDANIYLPLVFSLGSIPTSYSVYCPVHYTCIILIPSPTPVTAVCDSLQVEGSTGSTSVRITGSTYPALEGTSITFHCSPGLTLIGPVSSTCMGNGEWEPDPRKVECKGNIYHIVVYS